jgi:lysozyme
MDCFKNLKWCWSTPPKPADVIQPKPIENISPTPITAKTRILGIDVSHYEPALDWKMASGPGQVKWMYTKATEGTGHVDSSLGKHVGGAKASGVLCGAYHFFHASMDAKVQADLYLKTVSGLSLELPHCLDWESSSADGVASAIQKMKAHTWLDIVERASGKTPVIYGGESFLRELSLDASFAKYPLWLAHYGVPESRLKIPAPWKKYTMWQFTDAGSVPGLAPGHHVDSNYFQGSLEELQALCK